MAENEISTISQEKGWGKFLTLDDQPLNLITGKQLQGKYIYKDEEKGSYYQGGIFNGQFHGTGTMYFKNGSKFTGHWIHGVCQMDDNTPGIEFSDGLKYDDSATWDYCNGTTDRKFYLERCHGLKPAGRENEIDTELKFKGEAHPIPDNAYDTGDGYYVPERRTVHTYEGENLRVADDDEHYWIIKYCRKGWDDFVGIESTWRMNNEIERKDYESALPRVSGSTTATGRS